MSDFTPAATRFTGRRMLAIMLAFFGTIIAVNGTMLSLAVSGFGGLVVQNSYVASQNFNRDRAAALAQPITGWSIRPAAQAGQPVLEIADDGRAVTGLALSAAVSRPTNGSEAQKMALRETAAGRYALDAPLSPGRWRVMLTTADGQRRSLTLTVPVR